MLIHSAILTGSLSLNSTDLSPVTGSAGFATTSSVNAIIAQTASFATTSSVDGILARTGSYSTTGSNQFNGNQSISGSITSNGTITAQTLVVQTITASVEFITGSNRFGTITSNTHEFTGSLLVTGSQSINGTLGVAIGGITELNVQQTGVTLGNIIGDTHQITGSLLISGSVNTSVGSGIIVGAGSYSNAPSSTRGAIQINGSSDRIINLGANDYIYNSPTLFRLLTTNATTNMDFVVGGSQRMFISGSGNVGIGTSSPVTAGGTYLGLNISGATGASLVLTSNTSHTYLYAVNGGNDFFIENAGAQVFRAGSSERMRITSTGTVQPGANGTQDLGTSSLRWANIYTNDLHLSNEDKVGGNDVDGTTGNWTIQEGEEHLYIINNKTGKKFKFSLEEIQ
jgi:hypothetical protein